MPNTEFSLKMPEGSPSEPAWTKDETRAAGFPEIGNRTWQSVFNVHTSRVMDIWEMPVFS